MMKKLFSTTLIVSVSCMMLFAAKLETLTLSTSLLPSKENNVNIITPEGFDATQEFPTVYLLNGFGGDNNTWISVQPKLEEIADNYGMVIVMPDGQNSWYWDSPVQPDMKMESFIIKELVPYVDANYPTIKKPSKRAVTGLSMGGQGAMYLAMRHPDVFGNVGSTSGGVDIRPFPKNWKMEEWLGEQSKNPENWNDHSIVNFVPTLIPGQLNIIFDCGTDDFFYQVNENLHTALLAADIPHDYISRPGNHSLPYWRNSILYQLLYFNEAFNRQ